CPGAVRIHDRARRGGPPRRSSRLRSRHEAIDQALGRARRRDRKRQNLTARRARRSPLQGRQGGDVKLYTYFRSSAAYRVRIALNLKGMRSEMIPIHLQKQGGLNKRPDYRAVNPQMRVRAWQLDSGEVLIQPLAIIEYPDEVDPKPPLLPRDPIERAKVRAIAQLIACDIHPLNNVGPLRYLK